MGLDVILYIKIITMSMSNRNGKKSIVIIDKLFENPLEMKKVDYQRFWVTVPYDIYIKNN